MNEAGGPHGATYPICVPAVNYEVLAVPGLAPVSFRGTPGLSDHTPLGTHCRYIKLNGVSRNVPCIAMLVDAAYAMGKVVPLVIT